MNPQTNHPYYNRDNHLNIFLSKSNLNQSTDTFDTQEFTAYISIVRKNFTVLDANCSVENVNGPSTGDRTILSISGYPNNARCIYDLVIEPDTEVLLQVEDFELEQNVDFLTYQDFAGVTKTLNNRDKVVFEGDKHNDTQKVVRIKFESDGSVQKGGFVLWFNKICKLVLKWLRWRLPDS